MRKMAKTARPEIILGSGSFGTGNFKTAEATKKACDLFRSHGHRRIDLARIYPIDDFGRAEKYMVETGAAAWATLDTKVTAFGPRSHSKESIAASVDASVEAFQHAPIDVLYLHMADATVSLYEAMEGINEQYKQGKFKRLGLSNQSPQQVEEMVKLAEDNGWCKPAVYQGHYNIVCRKAEATLLPVLRKHGISYFAFTPGGAGLFSGKVSKESVNLPVGRFSNNSPVGKFWSGAYLRNELLEISQLVRSEAQKHGISGQAAAYRWVLHHSALQPGDGIIVGGSSIEQFEENLDICDQVPLPTELVKVIDSTWAKAEPVAPWAWMDNDPIADGQVDMEKL